MFRNLPSITYILKTRSALLHSPFLNKLPYLFWKKKIDTKNFRQVHPLNWLWILSTRQMNFLWRFAKHCTFDLSCHMHEGNNNRGHRPNWSLLLKILVQIFHLTKCVSISLESWENLLFVFSSCSKSTARLKRLVGEIFRFFSIQDFLKKKIPTILLVVEN